MSEVGNVRDSFTGEIREQQRTQKWTGKRAWRIGRLYDITKDDVAASKVQVVDVATGEAEEWDRDLFLTFKLTVEGGDQKHEGVAQFTAPTQEAPPPQDNSLRGQIWRALSSVGMRNSK